VVIVSYVDANLMHCLNTGRSVTGILHFLNGTLIDWYSKKMSTVETATYGAEFVAARTCVEQLIDLRITLRYLGVPIREKCYMFGDNESVVNSAMHPYAKLHKRHTALSFHRVREAIASKKYVFTHIPGENNPADIVSKHWGYSSIWHMLRTLQYVEGDTIGAPGKDEKLCVPESRRTSFPNGEMVELASHVRVQKKKKEKKKESTNCKEDWGVSTSKDESVDRLVPTYLSSVESSLTMRDSCRSLTDRQVSDPPRQISDMPRRISDMPRQVAISQIILDRLLRCEPKERVEINSYNSQV